MGVFMIVKVCVGMLMFFRMYFYYKYDVNVVRFILECFDGIEVCLGF